MEPLTVARSASPARSRRLQLSIDQVRIDFSGDFLHRQRAVHKVDLVDAGVLRNMQGVVNAARIIIVVLRKASLDFHRAASGVDLDAHVVQLLLVACGLDRIDLNFIAVPSGDLDVAIDVVERNAAVRGEWNGLMKFLRDLGLSGKGDEQSEQRSEGCAGHPAIGMLMHHACLQSRA